jgi:NADPH-dependent ferric siderophore reductase
VRARREPSRFRRVLVRRTEHLSPWLVRVTLAGPELEGFTVDQPAASIRLLLPSHGANELVKEALRALKRRISDAVWRQLQVDFGRR